MSFSEKHSKSAGSIGGVGGARQAGGGADVLGFFLHFFSLGFEPSGQVESFEISSMGGVFLLAL